MADLTTAIGMVREATAAILRVHKVKPERVKKGKVIPAKGAAGFAGSAFCVVENKYLITANHVLSGGKVRDPKDKFYAFIVPDNGVAGYHFPIVSFPVERADVDIAVVELGPCATAGQGIRGVPVSFGPHPDGSRVVTVGFPAPEITEISVDKNGDYSGGQFFLKSHANEGIVSAQYDAADAIHVYELNVGWHHGESGGPIVALTDPTAIFSLMQHYRNVKSPHGVVAGPHRGCALSVVEQELRKLGATVV